MENPFSLPNDSYKRNLDIITAYQKDTAKYIQLQTGQPFTKCLAFIKQKLTPDQSNDAVDFKLINPDCLVLLKNKQGDRKPITIPFMSFIQVVVKNDFMMSPSLTVYRPPEQVESTHALYIAEGVKNRSRVKKEMFVAEQNGDKELVAIKDGEQNNLKINNNSYSGATVSTATILHYKSTHSSLTSTCRTATSYANASNEKFIMGNRHYYTPEITKANLVSLINNSDLSLIQAALDEHQLKYPTVDDTLACITYSTDPYWRSEEHLDKITTMVSNMQPVERAAVVYVGDLYHLHKLNPGWVVNFLLELSQIADANEPIDDATFNAYHSDVKMLANFLCFEEIAGRSKEKLLAEEPEVYYKVKNTGKHILEVLHKYTSVIRAFWLTPNLPSSVHAFPNSYRKAVIISDTDSTMFTLQHWVEQCFGRVSFSAAAKRVVFSMVFLVSELITHVLAIQSANMGVKANKIRLLSMKNEYYFAVLSMTTRSKHYFASQDAREGLMFTKHKMEIKGVGLRDSKVPKIINTGARNLMEKIINTIKDEKNIQMNEILREIGDIERSIINSIQSGSPEYMLTGQVKALDSYKNKDNATFAQYELWQTVFAPTMGSTKEPPYSVVKVSLLANNRTEIDQWCERMNNPNVANRLKEWLLANKRKDLTTLLVPATVVETTGIPPEIVAGVDIRKIVANTMASYYLILESLGVFMQDKNITRLVSDNY